MLELLILEKAGSSILYNMVSGIYSFIARVYDIMLKLSGNGKDALSIEFFNLGNIQTVMYTIAGVFMLFRVTVSAVNMIINPDMVSDRNAGAGKIVTRIVTSLAMLILFVPNGWIFDPDSGVLARLEAALLDDDGLIQKVTQSVTSVPNATDTSTSDASSSTTETDATSEDDENATATNTNTGSAKKLNCYYVNIYTNTGYKKDSTQKAKTVDAVYHITFYDDPTAGERTILNTTKYSYTVDTDNGYSALSNLSLSNPLIASGGAFDSFPTKCPHRIERITGNLYVNYNKKTSDSSHWYDRTGIVGYWQSYKSLKKSLSAHSKNINAEDPISKRATGQDSNNYLAGLKNESVNFSQMTMGTFLSCSDEEEDCEGLKKAALVSTTVDDQIVESMAKGTVHLDFFPAIIVGIGVLVWLLVLCVEVIIRRFKLMLLLMIAPIPIISYSDPNDKMFPEWSKMYASTYLDLFLKLIAIGFATALLDTLWVNHPSSLIETLFYIIAILLFAKMIPTIISKIFGIDSGHLGGSFKDILGMGKAALGLGAGAAIGGVAGLATGAKNMAAFANAKSSRLQPIRDKKKNGVALTDKEKKYLRSYRANMGLAGGAAIASGISGFLQGAGAGSKGKILAGASSIANSNKAKENQMVQNGLTPKQIMLEGFISKFRMTTPKDKIEYRLESTKALSEIVKGIRGSVDGLESAVKRIPQINDIAKLNARGLVSDVELKNIVTSAAEQLDQHRKSDGTYDNDYMIHGLQYKDMDGNVHTMADFKAGAFGYGIQSAEEEMNTYLRSIKGNVELAAILEKPVSDGGYGIKLEVSDTGLAGAQDVKGATFTAESKLKQEQIEIENSVEYKEAKALSDLYGKK